jgi:ribosome recycling factor
MSLPAGIEADPGGLSAHERREQIARLVEEAQRVSVADLTVRFGVTDASIRRDLIKVAHQRAEDGRVAVRNVRRHAKETMERLEKDHDISEDDLRRSEKELQRLTDQYVVEIDKILARKEEELGEV